MKSILLKPDECRKDLTCVARVMKVQPVRQHSGMFIVECERDHWAFESGTNGSIKTPVDHSEVKGYAPYAVGDIVYGGEYTKAAGLDEHKKRVLVGYRTGPCRWIDLSDEEWSKWINRNNPYAGCGKTAMPAWAARFHYEIMGVRCIQVQDLSQEHMLDCLEPFNWDYAESSDGTGDKFMYWDHLNGDPPKWADWISSCETLEDIFGAYWNQHHPGSYERNDWIWLYNLKQKASE